MSVFYLLIIFAVLCLISKWQRRRRFCYFIMLKTAPTKAEMDRLKLEIGKQLLPAIEILWQDVMVLTELDLIT